MKLVKPSLEIIEQEPGLNGMLRHIEKCGRTCYKSEDKITEESAPKFVDMIINRGHTAMIEHGTVYLDYPHNITSAACPLLKYDSNPHSIVRWHNGNRYVTTNYRVLLQNGWLGDLRWMRGETEHHAKRITVKFICDRGVSHEFVRHRVFSFAQESTRYCNYAKDKFGKELTFIIPSWIESDDFEIYRGLHWGEEVTYHTERITGDMNNYPVFRYLEGLLQAEDAYMTLLDESWIAQQARAILPNSLKTELVMTGTIEQWEEFFKLRCAKDAHPQARELAIPLWEEFNKRGYINDLA